MNDFPSLLKSNRGSRFQRFFLLANLKNCSLPLLQENPAEHEHEPGSQKVIEQILLCGVRLVSGERSPRVQNVIDGRFHLPVILTAVEASTGTLSHVAESSGLRLRPDALACHSSRILDHFATGREHQREVRSVSRA